VSGSPSLALLAAAARDLERNAHQVVRRDRTHRVADLYHPSDALVAEGEGSLQRHCSTHDQWVKVTRGDREGFDDRLQVGLEPRLRRVPPLQLARFDEVQLLHAQTPPARSDAIATAARLFHHQGYHGTGLAQLLTESGAPKGSFYFHFPGGKEQLAVEAVEASSATVEALIAGAAQRAHDAPDVVHRAGRAIARWLEKSNFEDGCAVATLAAEAAGTSPALRDACEKAYANWRRLFADALRERGVAASAARELATLTVAAIEGATLIARTERRADALRTVTAVLEAQVRARAPVTQSFQQGPRTPDRNV
jgi:TetR/AcrR family transcriptional regulator, lmrAB and yxaGH operons repressor